MKGLFFISLFFIMEGAWAFTCTSKVDPKKVVLFVDTRDSKKEVLAAERAACRRGESFHRMGFPINVKTYTQKLVGFARNDIAVSSLILSGHDGGGKIHGHAGGLNKYEAIHGMKAAYKQKPELLNQLKSAMLWGCWTNGPGEVAVWRSELPSLHMVGGFIDLGPLNTAEASGTVLEGLLVKEKAITTAKNTDSVKRMIASVNNINVTYAAVYATACDENLYYYNTNGIAAKSSPHFSKGTHFVNYDDTFSCHEKPEDFEEKLKLLRGYYSGAIPLPNNTRESELRKIYSYARNHSLCLGYLPLFNADRIMLMAFFEQVKSNFAQTFQNEIAAAVNEFNALKKEMNSVGINKWDIAPDLRDLKSYIQKGEKTFFAPTAGNLAGKNRIQIREMIQFLDGMVKHSALKSPKMSASVAKLKSLKTRMDTYLYQLNPSCMEYLQWYVYSPGVRTHARCN